MNFGGDWSRESGALLRLGPLNNSEAITNLMAEFLVLDGSRASNTNISTKPG